MLDYIGINLFKLLFLSTIIYFLLRILFFKCLCGWSDPLNIGLFFIAFSMAGFIFLPFAHHVGNSYWIICFSMFIFFFASSLPKLTKVHIERKLSIAENIQKNFVLLIMLIVLFSIINDAYSGNIAILRDGGISTRFSGASEGNRLLIWLNYSTVNLPIIFYALSTYRPVRRISLLTIILFTLKGVLFASKASLFFIPITLTTFHFLLGSYRGNGHNGDSVIKSKIFRRKLEIIIISLFVVLLAFFPLFAILIQGAASYVDGLNLIFSRLLSGFDNLIYVSIADLPMENIMEKYGFYSILMLYLSSVFKVLFDFRPEFNSVSEIIMSEVFSIDRSFLQRIPLPNSNLILESIWTNGFVLGILCLAFIGYASFLIRKKLLQKEYLKLIDVVLFNSFVLSPLIWFVSGMEFINYLIANMLLYVVFAVFFNIQQKEFVNKTKFRII